MQSPLPRIDDLEERAAIRQHCGGMTQAEAERLTAKDAGFPSWASAMAALGRK